MSQIEVTLELARVVSVELEGGCSTLELMDSPSQSDVELLAGLLRGPPGPEGPAGAGAAFVEQQFFASMGVVFNHNLQRIPKVEFRTIGGVVLLLAYQHLNTNQIQIGPLPVALDFIVNAS